MGTITIPDYRRAAQAELEQKMNINDEMVANGVIREDTISGRGWYIVIEQGGVYYLHHDGEVRMGVGEDTDKPAFWPSFQGANLFFSFWKIGVIADKKKK